MGAQLVKSLCKTNDVAGVEQPQQLSVGMIREGLKNVTAKANPLVEAGYARRRLQQ